MPRTHTIPRILLNRFSNQLPPGLLLWRARETLGVSRQQMAQYMGIPNFMLRKIEYGEIRMSTSFLLKIFMFGLDFWADGIHWVVDSSPDKKQKSE